MIKDITIVGSGTAGLLTALIIKKRFPEYKVRIVQSSTIGIIGVGEGSTEHWEEFRSFLSLPESEVINKTKATYKAGIRYLDWGKNDYLHIVDLSHKTISFSQYYERYGGTIYDDIENEKLFQSEMYDKGRVSCYFIPNQLHFDTNLLNEYLTNKAKELEIEIIDDLITDVSIDVNDNITSIKGEKQNYVSDFYVDCSGFKRVLIEKLGAKWKSYSKYLLTNKAMVFQTPKTETINAYTLAKAMKYGWRFRIPTQERYGNGYIFNDNFTDTDKAKKEVEEELGHEIDIGKEISFDPGCLDKSWIGNCAAIGLSYSFLEPLEATSIASTIQQAFLLINNLHGYTPGSVDRYNKKNQIIFDNIAEFVQLSYLCNREDTDFWKQIKQTPTLPGLQEKLNLWQERLPIEEDIVDSSYCIFRAANFIVKMHGMKLFNYENLKKEYESLHKNFRVKNKIECDNLLTEFPRHYQHDHRTLLNLIKEGKAPFSWPLRS